MFKILAVITIAIFLENTYGGSWVSGDTHNHTGSSSDCNGGTAISSFKDAVQDADHNFIIITDHDNPESIKYGEFWNGNISTANKLYGDRTHICLAGIEYSNPDAHWTVAGINPQDTNILNTTGNSKLEKWQKAIVNVNAKGGSISLNHPHDFPIVYLDFKMAVLAGMSTFEVFNGGDGWEDSDGIWQIGGWWDQVLMEGLKLSPLAGTDNHGGNHYGGYARSYIYVKEDSVTERSIIDGMKSGKTWAVGQMYSYDNLRAKCFSMDFTVDGKIMGETVAVSGSSATVHLKAVIAACGLDRHPKLSSVTLVAEGEAIWSTTTAGAVIDTVFPVSTINRKYLRMAIITENTNASVSEMRAFSAPIYLNNNGSAVQTYFRREAVESISIYPNPVNTEALVVMGIPLGSIKNVAVFDRKGRVVASFQPRPQSKIFWSTRGLPNGIYYLNYQLAHQHSSQKLVISR